MDKRKAGMPQSKEYIAGYDSGMNGANMSNCHFSLFATPEKTKEWERGNADGSYAREQRAKQRKRP